MNSIKIISPILNSNFPFTVYFKYFIMELKILGEKITSGSLILKYIVKKYDIIIITCKFSFITLFHFERNCSFQRTES